MLAISNVSLKASPASLLAGGYRHTSSFYHDIQCVLQRKWGGTRVALQHFLHDRRDIHETYLAIQEASNRGLVRPHEKRRIGAPPVRGISREAYTGKADIVRGLKA